MGIRYIRYFIQYLKWLFNKTYVTYPGYNCGCCGRWWDKEFKVPTYKANKFWNTWGLCPEEKGCMVNFEKKKESYANIPG